MKIISFGGQRECVRMAIATGLVCLSIGCGAPPVEGDAQSNQQGIEDGQLTHDYPSVGWLSDFTASDLCAATMLSPTVAITARHCVEDSRNNMKLIAGYDSTGGWVDHIVDTYIVHPPGVDLMMVHLATPMFTLPTHVSGDESLDAYMTLGGLPGDGTNCTAVG